MTLVHIVPWNAFILSEFDECLLVFLFGILDSGPDVHADATICLLLKMCHKFSLEDAPDDRVTLFITACIECEPVISKGGQGYACYGRKR
jgi:hypothetical protein